MGGSSLYLKWEILTQFDVLLSVLERKHDNKWSVGVIKDTTKDYGSGMHAPPRPGQKWLPRPTPTPKNFNTAQCPRCQLGIALNRARSDQSQIVGFVV